MKTIKTLIFIILVSCISALGQPKKQGESYRYFIISYICTWVTEKGMFFNREAFVKHIERDKKLMNPIIICIIEVSKEDLYCFNEKLK